MLGMWLGGWLPGSAERDQTTETKDWNLCNNWRGYRPSQSHAYDSDEKWRAGLILGSECKLQTLVYDILCIDLWRKVPENDARIMGLGLTANSKHWFATSTPSGGRCQKAMLWLWGQCRWLQTPSTGLRHPSSRRKAPKSEARSVERVLTSRLKETDQTTLWSSWPAYQWTLGRVGIRVDWSVSDQSLRPRLPPVESSSFQSSSAQCLSRP